MAIISMGIQAGGVQAVQQMQGIFGITSAQYSNDKMSTMAECISLSYIVHGYNTHLGYSVDDIIMNIGRPCLISRMTQYKYWLFFVLK